MRSSSLAILLITVSALACRNPPVAAHQRAEAVEGLVQGIHEHYIFQDVGDRAGQVIREKLDHGGYSQGRVVEFAEALTHDLRDLTHDGHFSVQYAPGFKRQDPNATPSQEEQEQEKAFAETKHGGVERAEVLPGNVGLLEIGMFFDKAFAANALTAAMDKVSGTQALIIDLRRNHGGNPETVALLCSYFFPEGVRVHLNDIYQRDERKRTEFWTSSSILGARYLGKPVFILISHETGSAAEEFAYDLHIQKRATLVGEITRGVANPGDAMAIGGGFIVFMPTGQAINPITNSNWEGVGVMPDVPTSPSDALRRACLLAKAAVH